LTYQLSANFSLHSEESSHVYDTRFSTICH
jgi:hypothetical protein